MKVILFEHGGKREITTKRDISPLVEPLNSCSKLLFTLTCTQTGFEFIGWTKLPDDIHNNEEGKFLVISSQNRQKLEILKNKILHIFGYKPKDWVKIPDLDYKIWDNRIKRQNNTRRKFR